MNNAPTDPPLDSGVKELEQVKNEVDILKTKVSAVRILSPNTEGAPTGKIVLGDKAGSLAPWLAHQVLADVAQSIADAVAKAVSEGRVLVTEDANLLRGDLVSHQAHELLSQRTVPLTALNETKCEAAITEVKDAINAYTAQEKSAGSDGEENSASRAQVLSSPRVSGQSLIAEEDSPAGASVRTAAGGEGETDSEEAQKAEEAATDTSAVGVALDLVRMTAVDYELTAASVSAEAGLLSRLTAGHLARTNDPAAATAARSAFNDAWDYAKKAQAARGQADLDLQAAADGRPKEEAKKAVETAKENEVAALQSVEAAWAHATSSVVGGRVVLLDGFAGVDPGGKTLTAFAGIQKAIDDLATKLVDLRKEMSKIEAEITERRSELAEVRTKWTKATEAEKRNENAIAGFRARLDDLGRQIDRRTVALAPAQTFLDHANARIKAAEAAIVTVTTFDAAGTSPLLRACSREGLHADQANAPDPITHVLYVGSTHLGADIVTRHSILGSSGRLGFLGGTNASWVLLSAQNRAVVNGGAASGAQAVTYDLGSGQYAQGPPMKVDASRLSADPLARMENFMRWAVMTTAFALLILSFVGVIALFV